MAAFHDHGRRGSRSGNSGGRGRRHGPDRGGGDSWDEDGPDEADLAPDDLASVRCSNCRKLILEDSEQCPYCKHWQTEEEPARKSMWFVVIVILCVLLILWGCVMLGNFDIFAWLHR